MRRAWRLLMPWVSASSAVTDGPDLPCSKSRVACSTLVRVPARIRHLLVKGEQKQFPAGKKQADKGQWGHCSEGLRQGSASFGRFCGGG